MTLAQFTSMSLPPERLVSLLLPNFFGNSSTGSYWGREAGFFIQLCAYVGILPLLLSLVAGWERKDCTTGFFCALAGVSLVLALGHYTALFEWLYYIPGLKAFRIPARFLLWFAFAVAVLAGLGADHVLEGRQQRSYKNWWYVCLGLALMAGGMIWLNRDILLAPEPALERWGQMLERYQEDLFQDLWRLGIALTAGGWVLTGGGKGKRSWKIAVLAPLLIYVDLFHFGYRFNDTIDPEIYRQTPSTALAILADRKEEINGIKPRILGLVAEKNSPYNWHSGWVHDLSSYRKYAQTLRLYTGSTYGLANALPGWSPLHLQRQWEFVSGYPRFADLAGIEYAVNYGTLKWPGWERVAGDELQVYRNSQTLPRVYSVGDYRVILDRGKRLSYLKSKRFEAGRQVVLEEEPDEKFNTEPGSAQIVSYSAEEIEIAWRGGGGLLVLNDTYYPGWRVFVDGWEGRIMRANHVFRAVSVPSGSREIVFQYRPQSFVWGMWISLTTLLGLAILVLYGRHRTIGDMRPLPDEIEGLKAWTAQAILIVAIHAWVIQGSAWLQMFERSRVLKVLGIG